MIERSSGLDHSYQAQTHEHTVTDCIHEEEGLSKISGGVVGISSAETEQAQRVQTQEAFSFRSLLTNGWKSVISKAVRFWNDSGEEGKEDGKNILAATEEKNTIFPAEESMPAASGEKGEGSRQEEAILATSILKNDSQRNEEADFAEEDARKVNDIEGAASGGLKKEQGGLRKFLQKFEETVLNATGLWKKSKSTKISPQLGVSPKGENHSYLMDSYNKSGEYSTLARDKSSEGNFKARV